MTRLLGLAGWLLAAAFTIGLPGAAAAQSPPIEAYAALATIRSVAVSPDGTNLAYIRREGTSVKVIVQTRRGEVLAAVETGEMKLRALDWVSPDHVAVSWISPQRFPFGGVRQNFQLVDILNVRTRSFVRVLDKADYNAYSSVFDWRGGTYRGRPVLYAEALTYEQGDLRLDVYRVDLDTGRGFRQTRGDSDTQGYVLNAEGEPTARIAYQPGNGLWRLAARTGSGWREIHTERALLDQPSVPGMGRTSDSLMLSRALAEGGRSITEIAVADGSVRETFEMDREIDRIFHDNRGLMVGFGYTDVYREHRLFEPRLQAALDVFKTALSGVQISIESFSDDYSVVCVYVEGTGETGGYYLYDATEQRVSIVGRAYPLVPAGAQSEVRIIRYEAADGLPLFGYLTLPAGREPRGLPVVMLPHGGPQARDEAGYDWLSQGIASRGYAVFRPQFRGSDGLGRDLLQAGYGEWGKKMQSDVSDGLRHLTRLGIVDPARACIVGWSYGGYVALAGMAMEPGTYRCAVSVAGVSDLNAMLRRAEFEGGRGDDNPTIRYWKRFMGAESSSDPSLATRSPASHASAVQGPVLLIHGRSDLVVPFEQSQIMLRALGGEGPIARLIAFDGEDHSLSGQQARTRMLTETAAFLATHNPAD
ncbi:S9 family peptidase [Brevundimonas sp. LM2]|uniref:alpha/beta hydrolase family protein n=1 Tax=Brevundimonas sp. LM2 TaxID=1938605 RepID=UPI0015595D92|nr:alpha/beta fold hydrolase [Brevundimonas sp. LM2]